MRQTLTYEPMGRLKTLSTDEGRTYVQNTYDTATVSTAPNTNYPLGKLTESIGSTFPLDPGPSVQQDFGYAGVGGRVSIKVTTIGSDRDPNDGVGVRDGESIAATESWTYNTLGLVSTYNHPRVSPNTYQEAPSYTNGLPTSGISGGSNAYSGGQYSAAGALWKWTDPSAVQTTITPNVIPSRPASIATSNGGFNTSTYAYDGAGNITAIGSDNFKYDARSRLASALYSGQSATCTDSLGNPSRGQCFFYDRFGNLTNLTGVNPRTLTTSTTTNQLTAQTYDTRGNMISQGVFDGINRVQSGSGWIYFYDGAGERIAKFPDNNLLRREMAKLIVQARGEQPLSTGCTGAVDSYFTADVACSDPDRLWIDQIHTDGIASGYGGGSYGPGNPVRRDEMSKFIVLGRHEQGATGCDPNNLTFSDVDCSNQFWGYIQQIYNDGITQGCGTQNGHLIYCPANNVPESQMLAFLSRGWSGFHFVPRGTIYTLRDASGRVATEMMSTPGSTSYPTADFPVATTATRDNVFLGNLLVASYASSALGGFVGWSYYHSDHLGTPRYITGVETGSPKYWPYGDEVTGNPVTSERLKFATMERDTEVTRFYDHARSHDFNLGRFVGVDALGGKATDPQSWNRYAYARNNPIRAVDSNGLSWLLFNADRGTLALYSHEGRLLDTFSASNHPQHSARIEPLRAGRYQFLDRTMPHFHSTATAAGLDTPQGAFGIWGIFRLAPYSDSYGLHTDVGIHAGREGKLDLSGKREGADYPTNGCVRTCETAMATIVATALTDPLEYLAVETTVSGDQSSEDRVAAGLQDIERNNNSFFAQSFDFASVYGEGYSDFMDFLAASRE